MTVYVVLVDDEKPRDDSSNQTTSFFPSETQKTFTQKTFLFSLVLANSLS